MMDAATLGSPALSRAMVEAIRDPLLVLDVDLRVLVANGAFYRNFGVSPDDTQGKPVYQLGNGQWDIPALRTLLEDVLARQASFDGFEVAHDFPGLGRRVMLLNGRRIAPDGGRDALILLAIEDVTERKRADDLLARYREELERSNTDLEQFAYVASHDLQEPLRMVSSYAQLLARRYRGRLDPDADDFIAYVVDGANRMKVLINDLLSYSRLGVGDLQRVPVAFDGALDRVLESLEGAIEESGAVITRTALPSVVCDASQIGQLLQNLLSNAIKFHGPRPPRIRVAAERRANEWVFSVADEGIGIDPAYFGRIFIIFQRLHGKDQFPGTGVGLAICKRIVERHGGRLWVDSRPGVGSTFFFSLPDQGVPA